MASLKATYEAVENEGAPLVGQTIRCHPKLGDNLNEFKEFKLTDANHFPHEIYELKEDDLITAVKDIGPKHWATFHGPYDDRGNAELLTVFYYKKSNGKIFKRPVQCGKHMHSGTNHNAKYWETLLTTLGTENKAWDTIKKHHNRDGEAGAPIVPWQMFYYKLNNMLPSQSGVTGAINHTFGTAFGQDVAATRAAMAQYQSGFNVTGGFSRNHMGSAKPDDYVSGGEGDGKISNAVLQAFSASYNDGVQTITDPDHRAASVHQTTNQQLGTRKLFGLVKKHIEAELPWLNDIAEQADGLTFSSFKNCLKAEERLLDQRQQDNPNQDFEHEVQLLLNKKKKVEEVICMINLLYSAQDLKDRRDELFSKINEQPAKKSRLGL